MHQRVVVVAELVQHPAFAVGLHLQRQIARVFHATALGRENQLGTVGAHALRTLDAQVLGHDQQHAVATDGCHHRQRDAGIAASRLDQGIAGADLATRLGLQDHGQRCAVLDRAGRVIALQLAQNNVAAGGILLCVDALQRHQRGSADELLNGGIGHGSWPDKRYQLLLPILLPSPEPHAG